MGFSFRKADLCHHVYRKGDPEKYGSVCPHCQKRWGHTKPAGFIDIERCPTCPSLQILATRDETKKKAKVKVDSKLIKKFSRLVKNNVQM